MHALYFTAYIYRLYKYLQNKKNNNNDEHLRCWLGFVGYDLYEAVCGEEKGAKRSAKKISLKTKHLFSD